MDVRQFTMIVSNVEYKPGTKFGVAHREGSPGVTLWGSFMVRNAKNIAMEAYVSSHKNLTLERLATFNTEDDVLGVVYELVAHFEMHEIHEFLKYKGNYYRDPHPELGDVKHRGFFDKMMSAIQGMTDDSPVSGKN